LVPSSTQPGASPIALFYTTTSLVEVHRVL
jgi:hypothetical protein